jgi:TonB family protein
VSIPSLRPFALAILVLSLGDVAFAADPKQDEAAKLDEYQVGGNKKVKKDASAVAKVERPKIAVDTGMQFDKPIIEVAPMVVAPMQVAPPPAAAAPAVAAAANPTVVKPVATTAAPKPQASPAGSTPVLPVVPKPQAAPSGALPQAAGGGAAAELVAISTPAPEYPREASMAGITGFVVVGFTLNVEGVPQDITIVESSPPRTFDQSARRAVARWRFQPVVVNGQPVERKVQRRIDFK